MDRGFVQTPPTHPAVGLQSVCFEMGKPKNGESRLHRSEIEKPEGGGKKQPDAKKNNLIVSETHG